MPAMGTPCAHSWHKHVIIWHYKLVRIQLGTYMYIVYPAYCFKPLENSFEYVPVLIGILDVPLCRV